MVDEVCIDQDLVWWHESLVVFEKEVGSYLRSGCFLGGLVRERKSGKRGDEHFMDGVLGILRLKGGGL